MRYLYHKTIEIILWYSNNFCLIWKKARLENMHLNLPI